MIEEPGKVIAVDDGLAWVETQRRSTCEGCSANKGCGVPLLARLAGTRVHRVLAVNRTGARVGDEVMLGLQERALLRGSLAVYAVPLLGLIGGALIGDLLGTRLGAGGTDGADIVFGLGGLALALVWVRVFANAAARDGSYQPVILRKLG